MDWYWIFSTAGPRRGYCRGALPAAKCQPGRSLPPAAGVVPQPGPAGCLPVAGQTRLERRQLDDDMVVAELKDVMTLGYQY